MFRILRIFIFIAFLFAAGQTAAQEFLWNTRLDWQFDNREYKSEINWPQTLFGARLTPEVGIGWDRLFPDEGGVGSTYGGSPHGLMIGVNLMADFGAKTFHTNPDLVFYYRYHSEKFRAWAGILPRHSVIGQYGNAFFSDSVRFYDANLDGLLLQYLGRRGYLEFACDWNSMLGETTREKFMLFSSGRFNTPVFYMGYNASMYHHAGTALVDGVVDNVLLNPFAGVDATRKTGLDSLTLQVGWLQAFQNDRRYVGRYVKPGGVQIELRVEQWHFGVFNTLYLGDNLMPYYDTTYPDDPELPLLEPYGHGLYFGEPFYRTTSGVYNRLELYWQPIRRAYMNLRVASIHHYDGRKWGWQQMVTFSINLNEGMFSRKKR